MFPLFPRLSAPPARRAAAALTVAGALCAVLAAPPSWAQVPAPSPAPAPAASAPAPAPAPAAPGSASTPAPLAATTQAAPADPAYLPELQRRAREAALARDPLWRKLLHVQRHPLTGRERSLADDDGFFLARDGRTDLAAELDATLAAFFDPTPRHALGQSAQCRFVARAGWLRERLAIDPARLPVDPCPRFTEWRAGINPGRVSLVFPAAFLNSPASMYGHTFLRLDPAGQGDAPPLLSYAISYAADGNENEGLAFALKGLFGLYPGVFTNSPYYLRIRDYNDLENRDIWEYELSLQGEEIERLLAHAWELGTTRFDYWFFDENCAYHLLSLIDIARPGLDLSAGFTWWTIPVDTVKAVTATPGLLRAVRWRASNSTELRHRAALIGPALAAQAQALGDATLSLADWQADPATRALDPATRALVLEAAERRLAYRGAQGGMDGDAVQRERMRLLAARAALPAVAVPPAPRPAVPPQAGHGTARVDLLAGRRDGRDAWQLMARPAYHDLQDPEAGYQRGAQIQFGRVELGRTAGGGLRLERLTPVDIVSLTPIAPMVDGGSWKVRFGAVRGWADADGRTRLGAEVQGGPGRAVEIGSGERLLAYAFMDNHLAWDRSLARRPFAAGTGLAVGLLADPLPGWRLQLDAWRRWYLADAPGERGASLAQRVRLDPRHNLLLRCEWRERADQAAPRRECFGGVQRYF